VTGSGRLAGIDVADNDDVDVGTLFLTHGDGLTFVVLWKILEKSV
jgi:hypothetical protein